MTITPCEASLRALLSQRIVLLDGAMGTMIQQYKLSESDYRGTRFAQSTILLQGNNELLNLTHPEIIQSIHQQYLAAGADIIETNTFGANRIAQQDYQLTDCVVEMNRQAVYIAKQACAQFSDKPRFVAGALGSHT